jgi:hypothetical protein
VGHDGRVSDEEKNESGESKGPANKPQSTDDLKRFLNSDPDELPTAQARTPEFGPGGDDADRNESDVGRGEDDANLVADQPLSAQQSEDDVPDEVQEPEEVDEDGDEIQKETDTAQDKPD